jgi:phosphate transport system protein
MPRETLDNKIRHLYDAILVMDSMIEHATMGAVESLLKRDLDHAQQIIENDNLINAKRFELENDIIVTIATQQPIMAGDLRLMASILDIVGELERMGDYAKGISRVTLLIGDHPHIKPLNHIPKMAELTISMLHRAITAFVNQDVDTARKIPEEDDVIDNLYKRIYRELVAVMLEDPSTIDRANNLMWVAHNLERMADRVTNICERTIYIATGSLVELSPSDDEMISYT